MAKKQTKAMAQAEPQEAAALPTEHGPLRLVYMNPGDLTPNESNWRSHPENQMAALSDVIGQVGWAGACLYNESTGRLIDGHARRKLAIENGEKEIPVLVGSWTEEQEKLILATLDPLGALAEADAGKLDALLKEVETGSEALAEMLAGMGKTDLSAVVFQQPDAPNGTTDSLDSTPLKQPATSQCCVITAVVSRDVKNRWDAWKVKAGVVSDALALDRILTEAQCSRCIQGR